MHKINKKLNYHSKGNIHKKGFTLVELIIVITILAILATIAFISFQSYTKNTRDSNRLSTMKNIEKGLQLYEVKTSKYPQTENYTTITASGVTIGYQGIVGENVSRNINIGTVPKDPKTKENYVYYTNTDNKKYQLMGFMEGSEYKNNFAFLGIGNTYADNSLFFPKSLGNPLGILLDENNNPVSGDEIDIVNTNTIYKAYFDDDDVITGTGEVLKAGIGGGGLVGYWDFDEGSGNIVYDKSGNNNNGTLSGVTLPTWTGGKVGGALSFSSSIITNPTSLAQYSISGGVVLIDKYIGNKNILDNLNFTFSFWAKSSINSDEKYVMQIIKNHTSNTLVEPTYSFSWSHGKEEFSNSSEINTGNGNWSKTKTKTFLEKNKWYLITSSYDGNNLKIYVNGNFENSTFVGGKVSLGDGKIHIGQGGAKTSDIINECFNGIVDEVRIYNRALSDSEIKQLYNYSK